MNEQGFIAALRDTPGDQAALNAYKDWFTDQGYDPPPHLTDKKIREPGDLVGQMLAEVAQDWDVGVLWFITIHGREFRFYNGDGDGSGNDVHIWIEDIVGSLDDLIGAPLTMAEEVSGEGNGEGTWTFYRFATVKGYVTVRWCGTSNGYYSESPSFEEVRRAG